MFGVITRIFPCFEPIVWFFIAFIFTVISFAIIFWISANICRLSAKISAGRKIGSAEKNGTEVGDKIDFQKRRI